MKYKLAQQMLTVERSCEHSFFISTKIEQLKHCKNCGCMKYEEDVTIKAKHLMFLCETDPIEILNQYSNAMKKQKKTINNYKDVIYQRYLVIRKNGIDNIKRMVQQFNLGQQIYHLALYFMDCIFLNVNNLNLDVELISSICVIISTKLKGIGRKGFSLSQIFGCHYDINRVKYTEVYCLKLLDHDLLQLTSYDIVNILLNNGIFFKSENDELKLFAENLESCVKEKLDSFVEDERFLDFTPIQVGFGLIGLTRDLFGLSIFPSQFENIYSIKLQQFINCYFVMKILYKPNIKLDNPKITFKKKPEGYLSRSDKTFYERLPDFSIYTQLHENSNAKDSCEIMSISTFDNSFSVENPIERKTYSSRYVGKYPKGAMETNYLKRYESKEHYFLRGNNNISSFDSNEYLSNKLFENNNNNNGVKAKYYQCCINYGENI